MLIKLQLVCEKYTKVFKFSDVGNLALLCRFKDLGDFQNNLNMNNSGTRRISLQSRFEASVRQINRRQSGERMGDISRDLGDSENDLTSYKVIQIIIYHLIKSLTELVNII